MVRWEEPLPCLRLLLQLTYGQIFEDEIDIMLHLGYLFMHWLFEKVRMRIFSFYAAIPDAMPLQDIWNLEKNIL